MNVSGTKPKPGKPAERRNPATQAAILTAARRLVSRAGYNRVTIEAIAAAARSGKQTIYRWWPTKAALYLEIFGALSDDTLFVAGGGRRTELRPLLRHLVRAWSRPLARAILTGLVSEARGNPAVARALTEQLVRRPARLIAGRLRAGRRADRLLAAETTAAAICARALFGHGRLDNRFADQLAAAARRN